MTVRRATITRNWRAAGAPSPRADDFVEIPMPATPAPAAPAPRIERRDIESRLQNWATWCASWGGYPRDSVPTEVICRILEEAALGLRASASTERRQTDEADAIAIERALWQLPSPQREMLRLHYVRARPWFGICHIVGIRARRWLFEERMAAARSDIATILDSGQRNVLTSGELSIKF